MRHRVCVPCAIQRLSRWRRHPRRKLAIVPRGKLEARFTSDTETCRPLRTAADELHCSDSHCIRAEATLDAEVG